MNVVESLKQTRGPETRTYRLLAVGWAVVVFAVMGPTLDWVEFSNGVEKLNVATALEMRRGGPWLIPTLEGESRVRKPPLTAWITALSIRPQTVQRISSLDPAEREEGRLDLVWQVRWPALLAMCLMLLATFELGKTLADAQAGLIAAIIAGTTVYFFRYARQGITDIQLTLWVVAANACLAKAMIERRGWGYILAGFAIGVAMMSKGPVALVQTIVPMLAYLTWTRVRGPEFRRQEASSPRPQIPGERRRKPLPAIIGVVLMLVVGLGWFGAIWWRDPSVAALWRKEVLRTDEVEKATSHFYDYLSLFPLMLPWTIFLIGGLIEASGRIRPKDSQRSEAGRGALYLLCLLVVPILIMSCFRDRKERYLLPMVAPAAIIAALAVQQFIRGKALDALGRLGVAAQWAILAAIVSFPVISALMNVESLRTVEGERWYSLPMAIGLLIAGALAIIAAARIRRNRLALIALTAFLALVGQAVFYHGYARGREGRSEMKPLADLIWQKHPAATVYNISGADGRRKMAPNDISIYLNRITPVVPTVAAIPLDKGPQIYIELWEKPDRDPEPGPADGWSYFHRVPRGKGWWMAFIRDGRGD